MMSIFAILAYQILSIDDESKFNNLAFLSALALMQLKFSLLCKIYFQIGLVFNHIKKFLMMLSQE